MEANDAFERAKDYALACVAAHPEERDAKKKGPPLRSG
jgi:hypothetical protein